MRRAAVVSIIAMLFIVAACASWDESDYLDDGYQYMAKGNYTMAEEYFKKVLDINPENPYALLNLGVVYQNTDRFEEAKEMYRKVIALNPEQKPSEVTRDEAKGKSLVEIAERNLAILEYR